jgi:hypothetical protein
MSLIKLIKEEYNKFLKEYEEYVGDHKPPGKDTGHPLHDVSKIFGDDFYKLPSNEVARYYGSGYNFDVLLVDIIKFYKDTPNESIKIYRTIPDFHSITKKKIDDLLFIARYYDGFRFFPPTYDKKYKKYEDLIEKYKEKVITEKPNLKYDEIQKEASQLMYRDAYDLKDTLGKYNINPGDWVAINREYAVNHGKSNLNNKYKILTKTVKAKDLYTEGYIEEWGYDPQ